jgi:hypothetical protein
MTTAVLYCIVSDCLVQVVVVGVRVCCEMVELCSHCMLTRHMVLYLVALLQGIHPQQ